MAAHMRSSARRFYVVSDDAEPTSYPTRPRFAPDAGVRANVVAMAQWEWGERRAAWVAALADDLISTGALVDDTTDPVDAAQWVAAILCAAAADSGRDRRPGMWSRTLAGISAMTGVERAVITERYEQLPPARRAV